MEWLARAATGDCVTRTVLRALAELEDGAGEHSALRSEVAFGQARGRLMLGDTARAKRGFEALVADPYVGAAARACVARLEGDPSADAR